MIKFSKESKTTFFCLLVVPLVWMTLNHFGYLDYLKTKSLDWRIQARGELTQINDSKKADYISVEGNKTVPRIPKVTYVNFDASTLAMDGVGERPWDRAFFRDTALALIERGNARVLGFDFGFTPKSMSQMVPKENSFRSDAAMGELVSKYPDRVVLGCLYSGVPTKFVKPTGVSAFPPFFYDGFSLEESIRSKKYHYPESPTYPLISYGDNSYLGRIGSFTVPPFRAVDEIPRWVPLWFPSMGKAHAYNILGGKQSKLEFEMPQENIKQIELLQSEILQNGEDQKELQEILSAKAQQIVVLQQKKETTEDEYNKMSADLEKAKELQVVVSNFRNTLKVNQALSNVIKPQIEQRLNELDQIFVSFVEDINSSGSLSNEEVAMKKTRLSQLDEEISNFENSLKGNPSMEGIIKPLIDLRVSEKSKLIMQLKDASQKKLTLTSLQRETAMEGLVEKFESRKADLTKLSNEIATQSEELLSEKKKKDKLSADLDIIEFELFKLQGKSQTFLVEGNETLRLVYASPTGDPSDELVKSLPNEVPLLRDRNVFALGVESLLAYYGLDEQAVTIGKDGYFSISEENGEKLVECQMTENQFLEVNWFTKWTENLEERSLMKEAKKPMLMVK